MRKFITITLILAVYAGFSQDSDVRIKITGDQFERMFTVRFGAMESKDVKVSVLDVYGKPFYKDSLSGVGFVKQYDLSKLPYGLYSFKIEYGGSSPYTEDVLLQSKKDLMKQSVVLQKEIDKVKVTVAEYNNEPVSVFFLKADGSSAGYDYFESATVKERQYSLAKFAGASKVEVVQNGEVMLSESL